ncbi:DNA-binding helix-turn-helix protein, partial [Enterococcus faecalis TX0104]
MTLFERISYLAKKQGLSVFDLAEKLNLSRNSIYSWKKSSPKAETLEKVAEYFDVTTDYLLGRTDNPNS